MEGEDGEAEGGGEGGGEEDYRVRDVQEDDAEEGE